MVSGKGMYNNITISNLLSLITVLVVVLVYCEGKGLIMV